MNRFLSTRAAKWRVAAFLAAATTLAVVGGAPLPAQAHGSGVVKSCLPNTDCTTNSANNAVFAICDPLDANPAVSCSPGRDVTIQVSNFGNGVTVHVWWLNGEVDNPLTSDCTQAVLGRQGSVTGRTALGDVVTSSSTGKASLDAHLPPAGATPGTWSYGSNWICATTVTAGSAGGVIGDQLFAVYPA